jgi:hypothetical protein
MCVLAACKGKRPASGQHERVIVVNSWKSKELD